MRLASGLNELLITLLSRIYRYAISPVLHALAGGGFGCRFTPTCSEYSFEALKTYGWWKGGRMAVRRISRCHPFSGASGWDPVPRAQRPDTQARIH